LDIWKISMSADGLWARGQQILCFFFVPSGAGSLAKCWFITQAIEMLNQALGQKTDREISFGPSPNSRTTVRFFPCVFCRLRVSHFVVNASYPSWLFSISHSSPSGQCCTRDVLNSSNLLDLPN
jgi:hypothetical protein